MAEKDNVRKLIIVLNVILLIFLGRALLDVLYYLLKGDLLYAVAGIIRSTILLILVYFNRKRNKVSLAFTAFSCANSIVGIIRDIPSHESKYLAWSLIFDFFSCLLSLTALMLVLVIFKIMKGGNVRDIVLYIKSLDSEKSFGKSIYRFMFLAQLIFLTISTAACTYLLMTDETYPVGNVYPVVGVWALLCIIGTIPIKKAKIRNL